MIRLALVLALAFALEAGAQTFPTPGPGHVPWVATAGGGATFPAANGVEQRCTDLGANCICSEPLNTNDGEITAVNYNFPGSNSATDCGGANAEDASISPSLGGGHYPTFFSTNLFGSSAYALRGGSGYGYFFFHGKKVTNTLVLNSSDTQVCWRIYKWVSSDYGNSGGDPSVTKGECAPGTTWRNKMFQANFSNQAQAFQPEEEPSGAGTGAECRTGTNYGPIDGGNDVPPPGGGWSGVLHISPDVRWDSCKNKPCRLEFCLESRDAAGVRGGNRIVARTRVKSLDTGVMGSSATPETTGWGTISGYDSSGVNADHTGPGYNLYNMFIQTKSQANPDVTTHWPGCAPEVEGTVRCPVAGGP